LITGPRRSLGIAALLGMADAQAARPPFQEGIVAGIGAGAGRGASAAVIKA
jgi:hypothetical protein